ncbi:hypothetical protein [Jannaschia marina]|uniref:hypothetical protein n=1 Tax=Jannaschia marina TaxID=2741674 RepID=UPI0015CC6892|nr:hypothetical protein [Jannaschia marina]
MTTCPDCGGFGVRPRREACTGCAGRGKSVAAETCDVCSGAGWTQTRVACGQCGGKGDVPAPKAPRERRRRPAPTGLRLYDSSAWMLGWVERLPRWVVWSVAVVSGAGCAIWATRQPDMLNGVVILVGFSGLFLPVLAYGALRYVLGLGQKMIVGALQLAVGLFVFYVAAVALGLVTP